MTRDELAADLDATWPGAGALFLAMKPGERRQIGARTWLVCTEAGAELTVPPLTVREICDRRRSAQEAERLAIVREIWRGR